MQYKIQQPKIVFEVRKRSVFILTLQFFFLLSLSSGETRKENLAESDNELAGADTTVNTKVLTL